MAALEAGSRALDFALPTVDNKTYSLAESLKEGPVLAAFFKSSCPICQLTFPFLERFQRHFRDTKAQVWAVCQDERQEAQAFAAEYGLTMPVLLDELEQNYPVSNAYGLTHVPTVFLIGQAGDILQTSVGFVRKDLVQMGRKLEVLTSRKGFVPLPGGRRSSRVETWLKLQELAPGRGQLILVEFSNQLFLVLGGFAFARVRNGAGRRRGAQALARYGSDFFHGAEPAPVPARSNHRATSRRSHLALKGAGPFGQPAESLAAAHSIVSESIWNDSMRAGGRLWESNPSLLVRNSHRL